MTLLSSFRLPKINEFHTSIHGFTNKTRSALWLAGFLKNIESCGNTSLTLFLSIFLFLICFNHILKVSKNLSKASIIWVPYNRIIFPFFLKNLRILFSNYLQKQLFVPWKKKILIFVFPWTKIKLYYIFDLLDNVT